MNEVEKSSAKCIKHSEESPKERFKNNLKDVIEISQKKLTSQVPNAHSIAKNTSEVSPEKIDKIFSLLKEEKEETYPLVR